MTTLASKKLKERPELFQPLSMSQLLQELEIEVERLRTLEARADRFGLIVTMMHISSGRRNFGFARRFIDGMPRASSLLKLPRSLMKRIRKQTNAAIQSFRENRTG